VTTAVRPAAQAPEPRATALAALAERFGDRLSTAPAVPGKIIMLGSTTPPDI
jgi:hypothetical protein